MTRNLLLLAALVAGGCGDGDSGDGDSQSELDQGPLAADGSMPDGEPTDEAVADAELPHPGLTDPSLAMAQAPETFSVLFETTAGDFTVDVTRSWAPRGADRFYNLARIGFYDDTAFFRVIDGFVAQTGINGDPLVSAYWLAEPIADDPVIESNTRGRVTYATSGPDTRRTQIFFNYGDNSRLDAMGFAPFGEVREMTALDALYGGYGEGAPQGNGPEQGRIQGEGNAYLRAGFPELDYTLRARPIE